MEGIKITEPSENEIQRNWLDMKQRLDNKLSKFSGSDSLISKLRMNISDRCCAFAKNDVGIAQLIVPTGGGKTLSALRFAIEYAVEHKKERIFYISPFMSILEQNGDVIREIAGDDNYLEHHSDMYSKHKIKSLMNLRTMSCAAGIGINRLFALLWCSSLIHYSRPGPKL